MQIRSERGVRRSYRLHSRNRARGDQPTHRVSTGSSPVRESYRADLEEGSQKAGQFADLQLDAPLLVFIVTLHDSGELLFHQGHVELLLHNEPVLTWPRNHISAVLVGAFASDPPRGRVRGAILPGAKYALDPALLPDVELCRFRQWPPRDGEPSEIERINTQPDCPANPAARELIRRVQAELDGRCRDKERVEKLDRWARGELTLSDSEVSNLFRSTDSGSSGGVSRGRPRRDRRLWRGV